MIVYSRPDGGVSICSPAPARLAELAAEGKTDAEALAMIQISCLETIPGATNIEHMDRSFIPVSREFRNAWEKLGVGGPTVNMPRARDIHARHLSAARAKALVVLEKREIRERLKGNAAVANRAATDRTAVVGLNLTALAAQIAGAANPTALSAIWPVVLDEFRRRR